ncbi:hypothetical protein PAXRUDRAFT_826917 [Paxillus rubicundulus Ve08.2h10]|uniref:Uncharacterized protein n=1 Tax=Paxillus rubicundulus Ve08.2h10 TaxID=930991 RepID=A0A0D0DYY1_9AGAM|nr:hypothetical protein PAXRUDRAFT_826917 [Paxillus rubicundulus Ve08.2h10]
MTAVSALGTRILCIVSLRVTRKEAYEVFFFTFRGGIMSVVAPGDPLGLTMV